MNEYTFGLTYYSEVSAKFHFEVLEFPPSHIVLLTVDHPHNGTDLQTWYWFSDIWGDKQSLKQGVANGDEETKRMAEGVGIPRKLEYSTVVTDEREGILDLLDRAAQKLWPGAKWHFEKHQDHLTEETMYMGFRQDVLYAFLLRGWVPADHGSVPEGMWVPEWNDRNI